MTRSNFRNSTFSPRLSKLIFEIDLLPLGYLHSHPSSSELVAFYFQNAIIITELYCFVTTHGPPSRTSFAEKGHIRIVLAKIKWPLLYRRPLVVDDRRGSSPFLAITRRRDETFRRGAIMPRNHAAYEHKSSRCVRKKGVTGMNFRANYGHACLDARVTTVFGFRLRA